MHWLIAPDSFKGSLGAREAANAMAAGVRHCDPRASIDILPVADGGEGTAGVFLSLEGSRAFTAAARNQEGARIDAPWGLLPDGARAVCDAASCLGLDLVPPARRDPLRFSSAGLADLLLAALEAVPPALLVGLGGTGTNDCGYGMAAALGYRFFDASGKALPAFPTEEMDIVRLLTRVFRIEAPHTPNAMTEAHITGLCDVRNVLTGPAGATRTFGPQKGITPAMLEAVDKAIAHFSRIVRRDIRDVNPNIEGCGAAGGLGFALKAFLGAGLARGIDAVLDATEFDRRCRAADVVLSGEGRLDEQTVFGKAVSGVAERAHGAGKPLFVFAGSIRGTRNSLAEMLGAREVVRITPDGQDEEEALEKASENLETATFRALSAFLCEGFP